MWGDHASTNNQTIKGISATASLFYMANILAESARLQGKTVEAQEYLSYAEEIKSSFNARFFDAEKGY